MSNEISFLRYNFRGERISIDQRIRIVQSFQEDQNDDITKGRLTDILKTFYCDFFRAQAF